MNKADVNILVQVLFGDIYTFLLSIHLEVVLLGHMVSVWSTYELPNTFPKWLHHFILHWLCMAIPVAPYLWQVSKFRRRIQVWEETWVRRKSQGHFIVCFLCLLSVPAENTGHRGEPPIWLLNTLLQLSQQPFWVGIFIFHLQRKKVKYILLTFSLLVRIQSVLLALGSSGGERQQESWDTLLSSKFTVPGQGLRHEGSCEATDSKPVYKVVWCHFSLQWDIKWGNLSQRPARKCHHLHCFFLLNLGEHRVWSLTYHWNWLCHCGR